MRRVFSSVTERLRSGAFVVLGFLLGALLAAPLIADTGTLYSLRASNIRFSNGEYGLKIALSDAAGNQVTSFSGVSHGDDGAFTVGSSSMSPVGGIYRAALDSVDDGDAGAFAMLANRIQIVHLVDSAGATMAVGGGTQYTEGDTDASITGTAMLMEGAGDALVAAQGTAAAGLLVNVSNTNLDVQIGGSDTVAVSNAGLTELAAAIDTEIQADIVGALPAGTATIGYVGLRAEVGGTITDLTAHTEGSYTALDVILIDPSTNEAAVFAGACTPGSIIGGASVNETEIDDNAGILDWIAVSSIDATPVYLKLYDLDNDDLDETDTPILRFGVPANTTAANGSGVVFEFPGGMNFATAISFRVTTGLADNSTGAVTANEVLVSWCAR